MNFLIALLICITSVWAAPEAKVALLKGTATYMGKTISQGETLTGNGEISVGDKSYLKLLLTEGGHTVALSANSVSKLSFNDPSLKDSVGLLKGYGRWITGAGSKSPNAGFRTKNATMGIRGTNFMSLYNEVLGETEIWVFDGHVEFANAANKADSKQVTKNQWGGIGGRFGKKCQEVLTLTPEIIGSVDKILPVE